MLLKKLNQIEKNIIYLILLKSNGRSNYNVEIQRKIFGLDFDYNKNNSIEAKNHHYWKIIVKIVYSIILKYNYSKINIKKTKNGKPYISKKIHFNVSHSNDIVAIAFSKRNIGIDIEIIQQSNNLIINKYYCNEEKQYVINGINKDYNFINIWTRKESYIKYKDLKKNSFKKMSQKNTLADKNYYTMNINNYILSIYSKIKDKKIIIYYLSEYELLNLMTLFNI